MNCELWDQRYSDEEYVYGKDPNEFLKKIASMIPDGPVLCLAEGEGRNAVYLSQLGHRVTAVDQSVAGLAKALSLAEAQGVAIEMVHSDLENYTIPSDSWSGIISIFAHLPQALRRKVHSKVVHGLKPGGIFILEAYTPAQLALGTGGPKIPEMLMTLTSLREELQGLDLLVSQEIERDVNEGKFHHGRGSVVQIVARKPGYADQR